ncbi:MAG: serine/threonine-protein kinase [Polyangiaceae bacterium]
MSVEAPTLSPGQVVDGKYQVVRLLGKGGMGAVYEAVHLGTSRRVAVKVIVSASLANEPDVVTRFQREARASGSIDSLHVVQVLDTGVDPVTNDPYMVMEYLSGQDIHELVRRVGPLPPDLVVRIGAQACLGLQRAHDARIVHRDIKSANLFLSTRDGGEVQVKLLDFGIAKVRAEPMANAESHHLTTTGSMLGSPLYMSPEQARGMKTLDGRSDIWSLGVVLYEALTGAAPNNDKQTLGDLLVAICVEPVTPLQSRAPWVSPQLAAIVERALERSPDDRFQTAMDMHEALSALVPSTNIREEMLGPVSEAERAHVASAAPTGTGPVAQDARATEPGGEASAPAATHAAVSAFAASTSTPGVHLGAAAPATDLAASATSTTGKPKRAYWSLAVVPFALVAAAAVAFQVRTRGDASRDPTAEPSASPVVDVASANDVASTTPPTPPPSSSVAAPTKTVQVAVRAPTGAKVDLDGQPAELRDGSLSITGAPGSLHKVRLSHGDVSEETAVTILESGATLPPKIELVARRTVHKPAAAAVAASPTPPAPAKPTAPAAQPKKPPPTPPSEPSIKKEF